MRRRYVRFPSHSEETLVIQRTLDELDEFGPPLLPQYDATGTICGYVVDDDPALPGAVSFKPFFSCKF